MPVLLFKLNGVPVDEAGEVRDLLTENGIDYYETSGGSWGLSVQAIWLEDRRAYEKARSLIDGYQKERSVRMRALYRQLGQEGRRTTLLDNFRENPARFLLYLGIVVVILYLSIKPFVSLQFLK
jgi:hypothetical protein